MQQLDRTAADLRTELNNSALPQTQLPAARAIVAAAGRLRRSSGRAESQPPEWLRPLTPSGPPCAAVGGDAPPSVNAPPCVGVGDFVISAYAGGDLWFDEEQWGLRTDEEAEVTSIDDDGNPRLRNPSGQVTVACVDRAFLQLAPAPPKCQVGDRVVPRNTAGGDLTFDEEAWVLSAASEGEVVEVDADGNPRMRNPAGDTTKGFVDRRYVRAAACVSARV